jgi:AcrR family transcriptional regulator
VPTEQPTARPLRADAERNRQRILSAAREVFAARGLDASLDDVAAHAGVGVGTIYRRFPDKDALIDGLFEDKLATVERLASEALEVEDPWDGFESFMRGVCRLHAEDRGFKEALLGRDRGCAQLDRGRQAIAPIVEQLVARAQRSGQLRDDLGTFDVPMIHLMIAFVAERSGTVAPDYWERPLQVVLDGLRAGRATPTPLPAGPLDAQGWADVLSQRRC